MHHASAVRIVQLIYDATRRAFLATVEFFAPGLPQPMCVPVRVTARVDLPHPVLVRALVREAQRRGVGRL